MQQYSKLRDFLRDNHWPNGLQNALLQSIEIYPLRYFILDDSGKTKLWEISSFQFIYFICLFYLYEGSMMKYDGHILIQHNGKYV